MPHLPGNLEREGTVAELTRQLPSVIRFSLPGVVPPPPLPAEPSSNGTYVLETFTLPQDLKTLLLWSERLGVELQGLSAGSTGLDDVFRAIGSNDAAA